MLLSQYTSITPACLLPIPPILQRLQHPHRRANLTRQTRPTRRTRKQISEQLRRENLTAMISQKREHTASRNQMPNQSTSIHQIRITITSTLHPVIIPAGQPHHRQDAPVVQQSPRRISSGATTSA